MCVPGLLLPPVPADSEYRPDMLDLLPAELLPLVSSHWSSCNSMQDKDISIMSCKTGTGRKGTKLNPSTILPVTCFPFPNLQSMATSQDIKGSTGTYVGTTPVSGRPNCSPKGLTVQEAALPSTTCQTGCCTHTIAVIPSMCPELSVSFSGPLRKLRL